MTKKFTKSNKTKLIASMFACSLMVLGEISTVAYSITSCSKNNNPNPLAPITTSSFYTLSSDPTTPIYFEESSTPISNFCVNPSEEYTNSSISINGSNVNINDICSLKFGVSCGDIISVGSYWTLV